MESLIAIYLILASLAIAVKVAIDVRTGRTELVSIRNAFLTGFVLFQCTSAAVPLWTRQYPRYPLDTPSATALRYAAMVTMTVVVLFLAYDHGPFVKKLARRLPRGGRTPDFWKLLSLGACCLGMAAVFRFTLMIPLWGILANFAGISMAAVAAGIAGWVWAPRFLNPAVALVACAIILGAMAVAISGTFGRRGLVSVATCVGWGMYYSHLRTMPKKKYLPYLGVVLAAGVMFLAAVTSIRGQSHGKNFGPLDYLQALATSTDLRMGTMLLLGGQECGHVSMWLTEEFPERTDFDSYLTLRYIFLIPIPRHMWEEKPVPISLRIPVYAGLRKVPIGDLTIGPGFVGTAWADGGWLAVILYPLLYGMLFRLLDQWIRENLDNLFVVLPVGASVGEIIGIPRGEVSLFTFKYLFSLIAVWSVMLVFAKVLRFERRQAPHSQASPVLAGVPVALPMQDESREHDEEPPEADWSSLVNSHVPQDVEPRKHIDWAEVTGENDHDAAEWEQ